MKIGFVGLGNMGSALARGFAAKATDVEVGYFDPAVRSQEFKEFASVAELALWAGVLFLAVKPSVAQQACSELSGSLQVVDPLMVSIVAGLSGDKLERLLDEGRTGSGGFRRYVVAMPNTPMMVGEGVCCYYCGQDVSSADEQMIVALLGSLGLAKKVSIEQMDAVPALSGSSPAYVYQLIGAMGQAGVEQGFTAEDAYKLAAQSVLGAAKMVLECGEHPASLQDKVCSPRGSTIEAILQLQEHGFATAVHKAMQACTDKIKKMKKD